MSKSYPHGIQELLSALCCTVKFYEQTRTSFRELSSQSDCTFRSDDHPVSMKVGCPAGRKYCVSGDRLVCIANLMIKSILLTARSTCWQQVADFCSNSKHVLLRPFAFGFSLRSCLAVDCCSRSWVRSNVLRTVNLWLEWSKNLTGRTSELCCHVKM